MSLSNCNPLHLEWSGYDGLILFLKNFDIDFCLLGFRFHYPSCPSTLCQCSTMTQRWMLLNTSLSNHDPMVILAPSSSFGRNFTSTNCHRYQTPLGQNFPSDVRLKRTMSPPTGAIPVGYHSNCVTECVTHRSFGWPHVYVTYRRSLTRPCVLYSKKGLI